MLANSSFGHLQEYANLFSENRGDLGLGAWLFKNGTRQPEFGLI